MEKGEKGTIHVQFYVHFKTQKRRRALTKMFKHAHYTPVHRDNGVGEYCSKDATRIDGPWEHGVKPVRRNNKTDWEEVRKKAKEGKFDEIPGDIYVRYFGNLKKIHAENIKPVGTE